MERRRRGEDTWRLLVKVKGQVTVKVMLLVLLEVKVKVVVKFVEEEFVVAEVLLFSLSSPPPPGTRPSTRFRLAAIHCKGRGCTLSSFPCVNRGRSIVDSPEIARLLKANAQCRARREGRRPSSPESLL